MMWRLALAGALLSAVLGFGLWVQALRGENAALTASLAAQKRETAIVEARLTQVREARAVADAWAKRYEARSKELDDLKDTLQGVGDEPLPIWFRDYLRSLFPGGPD